MVLTIVAGEKGSGKTTFLDDVVQAHKCVYIRQNHNLHPKVPVCKIPSFDPSTLPFWKTYESAGTADTVKVGSGAVPESSDTLCPGHRKLLLFEFFYQHVIQQSNLSLVLDEPFAGVSNEYVPFILLRLHDLRQRHNILLATSDHVAVLKIMADDVIVISIFDLAHVQVNGLTNVGRENAVLALLMSRLVR